MFGFDAMKQFIKQSKVVNVSKIIAAVALFLLSLLNSSCLLSSCGGCSTRPGREEYLEIDKYEDDRDKLKKFSSYPTEKQIDIFLFAMSCVEPPDYSFERYLAHDGEGKIVSIAERLDETKSSYEKTVLIRVLRNINIKCGCVSRNAYVVDILYKNESKVGSWKDLYDEYLEDIKQNKWYPGY